MTMGRILMLPGFMGAILLMGCVQIDLDPNWARNVSAAEATGALAGGALGGYFGSQFGAGSGAAAMTGLGVVAGAALGRELGRTLDQTDKSVVPQSAPAHDAYGNCLAPPATLNPKPPGNGSLPVANAS